MLGPSLVIVPVMPEGVEHRPISWPLAKRISVIVPVMPEGVEHPKSNANVVTKQE